MNEQGDYIYEFGPFRLNDNFEVYVMNADGTEQTNLTNNSAVDFDTAVLVK